MSLDAWKPTQYRGDAARADAALRCWLCPQRVGDRCQAAGQPLESLLHDPVACPEGRWKDRRLHVLTTLFNPSRSQRITNNYHRFRESLPPEVTVHTAEATWGNDQPVVPDSLWVRADQRNTVWQKERLLNLLLQALPPEVEYIAWVDADVEFENPQWHTHALQALAHHATVQLFDTARWLSRDGGVEIEFLSAAAKAVTGVRDRWGHPGFAWAARRSAWRAGFFDVDPTGGADTFMSDHVCGTTNESPKSAALQSAYAAWRRLTPPGVGFVPGAVRHLWHGDWKDRQYVQRSQWVVQYNWDPFRDVIVDDNGLWKWTTANPVLQAQIAAYFPARKDDG